MNTAQWRDRTRSMRLRKHDRAKWLRRILLVCIAGMIVIGVLMSVVGRGLVCAAHPPGHPSKPILRLQMATDRVDVVNILGEPDTVVGQENRRKIRIIHGLDFVLIIFYVALLVCVASLGAFGARTWVKVLAGFSMVAMFASGFCDVMENLAILHVVDLDHAHLGAHTVPYWAFFKWELFFIAVAMIGICLLFSAKPTIPFMASGAFAGTAAVTASGYGLWALLHHRGAQIDTAADAVVVALGIVSFWALRAAFLRRRVSGRLWV